MSFDKIISIPGKSGLFKMIAQMRNGGFVVESLNDGKRTPISEMERIVMLKDISVFTIEEDIPLEDVFRKMKEQDDVASSVSIKADPEELKATLKKILPEFDQERVHASDIRKMFSWYNSLKDNFSFEKEEESKEENVEVAEKATSESAKPAKKKKVAEPEANTQDHSEKKTVRKSAKAKS